MPDGLVLGRLVRGRLGQNDGQVFGGRGAGPRVGVLRGGLGQPGRVTAGQALAVGRGRGQGRELGVAVGQGLSGRGGQDGQVPVARGQGGAGQPGGQRGITEQRPPPGLQVVSGPGGVASFLRRTLLGKGLGGPSLPLDVGRADDIPVHLRRMVALRDQHCQFPGRYFL
jgi:hypothetical protein